MKNLIYNEKFITNTLLSDNLKEEIISAKLLAERLGCSLSYVKKLRRQGKINPEISLGRFVRYNLKTVVEALKKRSLL